MPSNIILTCEHYEHIITACYTFSHLLLSYILLLHILCLIIYYYLCLKSKYYFHFTLNFQEFFYCMLSPRLKNNLFGACYFCVCVFLGIFYVPTHVICEKEFSSFPNCISLINFFLSFFSPPHCSNMNWLFIKPILHSRDKYHLIMVHNSFYILLDSVCWYFVRSFVCQEGYWSVVFTWKFVFAASGNTGITTLVGKQYAHLIYFLKEFVQDWSLYPTCLIEFIT